MFPPRLKVPDAIASRAELLGFSFIAAVGLGCIRAAREIAAQRYLELGLTRNAAIVFRDLLDHGLGLAVVLVTGVLVVEVLSRALMGKRRGRGRTRSWGIAVGLIVGLGLFLHQGWMWNRHTFSPEWRTHVEWHGLHLRKALFDWYVWRVNLIITLVSAISGIGSYFVVNAAVSILDRASIRRTLRTLLRPPAAAALLLLVAANVAPPLFFHRVPRGPNVLLISLDTLRGDHLSCYGYGRDTSPAIDRFAAASVRFENCYSQAPNTFPSHASLFTSRYPTLNRTSLHGQKLPRWRTTAAELFREAGYRTSAIVDAGFLTEQFGMAQGYDDFVGWGRRIRNIAPRAVKWLDRHGGEPFFLFVHCYDIHNPYATDPRYQTMYEQVAYSGIIDPAKHYLRAYMHAAMEGRTPGFQIGADDVRHLVARYDGGIRYTDDHLVQLFDALRAKGLLENTIVVLFSDHGEEFMEHGTVLHTELYRTVTHVPLIMSLPGGKKAGDVVRAPVGLIDLLPTLVDLTGIRSPVTFQGRSLVPLMDGQLDHAPRYIYGEFDDFGGRQAVYDGPFHLVKRIDRGQKQLFRVDEDPLEQVDLAPDDPGRVEALDAAVGEWVARQQEMMRDEAGLALEDLKLDPKTMENLRALGYLR